jgi:NAD(P)-dependent dehydrogenase (short-subunit alcohol dehydrogenase family)
VNNAGIAVFPYPEDAAKTRESFNTTFNTNITSIYLLTTALLPMLRLSASPRVINVSSGRASFALSTTPDFPPTAVVSYSVSKAALNLLTVEMQKAENKIDSRGKVEYFAASPGHCKTAFNSFRGTKDPVDGAEVVVRLMMGDGKKGGFYEFEKGVLRVVPW